jgi:hypothetical protein
MSSTVLCSSSFAPGDGADRESRGAHTRTEHVLLIDEINRGNLPRFSASSCTSPNTDGKVALMYGDAASSFELPSKPPDHRDDEHCRSTSSTQRSAGGRNPFDI